MDEQQINELVFEIEELLCDPDFITEPAGRGCGYGITDSGEKALIDLLRSKLPKNT